MTSRSSSFLYQTPPSIDCGDIVSLKTDGRPHNWKIETIRLDGSAVARRYNAPRKVMINSLTLVKKIPSGFFILPNSATTSFCEVVRACIRNIPSVSWRSADGRTRDIIRPRRWRESNLINGEGGFIQSALYAGSKIRGKRYAIFDGFSPNTSCVLDGDTVHVDGFQYTLCDYHDATLAELAEKECLELDQLVE